MLQKHHRYLIVAPSNVRVCFITIRNRKDPWRWRAFQRTHTARFEEVT